MTGNVNTAKGKGNKRSPDNRLPGCFDAAPKAGVGEKNMNHQKRISHGMVMPFPQKV